MDKEIQDVQTAWQEWKRTSNYGNTVEGLKSLGGEAATGLLWNAFYHGYLAGVKKDGVS